MKKLLFIIVTITVFAILSCKKESNMNSVNPVSTKWTMGATGLKDTIVTIKPQNTGDIQFKMSKYSLCPTHIVGVMVKVNNTIVFDKNLSQQDTFVQKIPVKMNDSVTIHTKLVETGAKIACIWLGVADCEITE